MTAKKTAYQIDFSHKQNCFRLTVTEEIMTLKTAEQIHHRLKMLSLCGGPYSAIFDLSAVKETLIPVDVVRGYGRRAPSVPTGKAHVVVGKAPAIFGLARIFQMCGEAVGKEHEVVHTLEEAYKIVGVQPEDFTERL